MKSNEEQNLVYHEILLSSLVSSKMNDDIRIYWN